MAMEFWGVEVKAGEPLKVEQLDGILVHLSQASLGELKKDKANESVVLYVNVDGQKLVIGTLSPDKCPQISYDLVFEKEFELSHSWKNGSVYFLGYKAEMEEEEGEDGMFDSDSGSEDVEEEEVPLAVPANGKPEPEAEKSKVVAAKAKAAKPATKAKDAKPDDDSDDGSDEEDDDSEEDSSDDEEMTGGVESDDEDEDEDEDEESSDEEAEAAPKNAEQNKKRAAESVANTPTAQKKAKLVTLRSQEKMERREMLTLLLHTLLRAERQIKRRISSHQSLGAKFLARPAAKPSTLILRCNPIQKQSTATPSEGWISIMV